jgi:hypothetical protein
MIKVTYYSSRKVSKDLKLVLAIVNSLKLDIKRLSFIFTVKEALTHDCYYGGAFQHPKLLFEYLKLVQIMMKQVLDLIKDERCTFNILSSIKIY